MFKWPIGRIGRGTMLLWLVIGSAGFSALQWFVFRRIDLIIELGFRSEAIRGVAAYPFWYAALEVLFDLGLIWVSIARLHDIGRSGWWLAAIPAGGVLAAATGASAIGLIVLAAWVALLFWPGAIGPNRFGADPSGWESREQYDAQMRELEQTQARRP